MRIKQVGTWIYNDNQGSTGDAGLYVEAVDATDDYRYAAISYGFLTEQDIAALRRGTIMACPMITPDELAQRLPRIGTR